MIRLTCFALATALSTAAFAQDSLQLPEGVEMTPEIAQMLEGMDPSMLNEIMEEVAAEMKNGGDDELLVECRGGAYEISPQRRATIARLSRYVEQRVTELKAEGSFDVAQNAYEFGRDCATALPMSTIPVGDFENEYGTGVNQNAAFALAQSYHRLSVDASQLVCSSMTEQEFRNYLVNGISRFASPGSQNARNSFVDEYSRRCGSVWYNVVLNENEEGGK